MEIEGKISRSQAAFLTYGSAMGNIVYTFTTGYGRNRQVVLGCCIYRGTYQCSFCIMDFISGLLQTGRHYFRSAGRRTWQIDLQMYHCYLLFIKYRNFGLHA